MAYNEIFNIVGDEKYRWKEVIDELGEILNCKPLYINLTKEELAVEIPERKGEILGGRGISQLLDNTKLKNIVPEFKTNISLHEGLTKTVEYYIKNEYLKGIDYKFDSTWDRITKKYASNEFGNIGFIDYLGNANISDRVIYYSGLHSNSMAKRIQNIAIKMKRYLQIS